MKRININKMPIYSTDGETIIGRVSAYRLSHIVSHLKFIKPSLRYPNRVDRIKSNVLRALCDRYPNVWAGLAEIADKAKCSTAQARRALRELETKDKLIVDVNSRLTWHRSDGRWILKSDDTGKKGGWGKEAPVQYFLCDRKICDIYHHQQAEEKRNKIKKRKPNQGSEQAHSGEAIRETAQPNHGSTYAHSGEHESPITGASKQPTPPSPLIAEPTILNQSKNLPPNLEAETTVAVAKDLITRVIARHMDA